MDPENTPRSSSRNHSGTIWQWKNVPKTNASFGNHEEEWAKLGQERVVSHCWRISTDSIVQPLAAKLSEHCCYLIKALQSLAKPFRIFGWHVRNPCHLVAPLSTMAERHSSHGRCTGSRACGALPGLTLRPRWEWRQMVEEGSEDLFGCIKGIHNRTLQGMSTGLLLTTYWLPLGTPTGGSR